MSNKKSSTFGSLLDLEYDERAQLRNPPRTSGVLVADVLVVLAALGYLVWRGLTWWGRPYGLLLPVAVTVVVFALPWTRRLVCNWFMRGLTRSRLRRGLWEARVCTRTGRLPVVLSVSTTEVGQRVRLWMRPGTALEQLGREDDRNVKLGIVRAALIAREVRFSRSPRWAALVTVEITRRNPLGRSTTIASPLADKAGRAARLVRQPSPTEPVRATGTE